MSVTDIENQGNYQALFRDDTAAPPPFIGLIVGTYDTQNASAAAVMRYFHVAPPPPDMEVEQVVPLALSATVRSFRRGEPPRRVTAPPPPPPAATTETPFALAGLRLGCACCKGPGPCQTAPVALPCASTVLHERGGGGGPDDDEPAESLLAPRRGAAMVLHERGGGGGPDDDEAPAPAPARRTAPMSFAAPSPRAASPPRPPPLDSLASLPPPVPLAPKTEVLQRMPPPAAEERAPIAPIAEAPPIAPD